MHTLVPTNHKQLKSTMHNLDISVTCFACVFNGLVVFGLTTTKTIVSCPRERVAHESDSIASDSSQPVECVATIRHLTVAVYLSADK